MTRRHSVLLVAPQAPPYGGVALQAHLLERLIRADGIDAAFVASNLPFPDGLRFCERIRGLRPFLRCAVMCVELWRKLRDAEVVHILACSWLYFFVVVCPAVVLARLRGKRVVLNYRGGEADAFFRRFAFAARPFFRLAHVVTAPSRFLVEIIGRRIGVPVRVVPNVANLDAFRFRARESFRPRMLVTRHLMKLYDVESVVRAFAEVQKRYPEASLWIAGTGDQEPHLRRLVSAMGLPNVEFRGYIPIEELPAVYDGRDILLNASRADNFPASLVEAAAAGLAVVSTDAGGIPYLFENEKTALLVPVGDWAALAAAVLRVLDDPELGPRLAREAHSQCSRYDWNSVRRVLYPLYGFEDSAAERGLAAAEALGQ
jgi:glycosyltransferase involved in cell wall biosynthesis